MALYVKQAVGLPEKMSASVEPSSFITSRYWIYMSL